MDMKNIIKNRNIELDVSDVKLWKLKTKIGLWIFGLGAILMGVKHPIVAEEGDTKIYWLSRV